MNTYFINLNNIINNILIIKIIIIKWFTSHKLLKLKILTGLSLFSFETIFIIFEDLELHLSNSAKWMIIKRKQVSTPQIVNTLVLPSSSGNIKSIIYVLKINLKFLK